MRLVEDLRVFDAINESRGNEDRLNPCLTFKWFLQRVKHFFPFESSKAQRVKT